MNSSDPTRKVGNTRFTTLLLLLSGDRELRCWSSKWSSNYRRTGLYAGAQSEHNSADATYILRKSTIFDANAFSKIRMSRLLDNNININSSETIK